jgi:hypothetical protein
MKRTPDAVRVVGDGLRRGVADEGADLVAGDRVEDKRDLSSVAGTKAAVVTG